MNGLPLHSPAPWHRFDEEIVDRCHDPVLTLHRERRAGETVRIQEAANAAAVLTAPSMLSTLMSLADSLREGAACGGLDAAECAFLAGLSMGEVIKAIGVEHVPLDAVISLKGGGR